MVAPLCNDLPDEMWIQVFRHLDNRGLNQVRQVCRAWRSFANEAVSCLCVYKWVRRPQFRIEESRSVEEVEQIANTFPNVQKVFLYAPVGPRLFQAISRWNLIHIAVKDALLANEHMQIPFMLACAGQFPQLQVLRSPYRGIPSNFYGLILEMCPQIYQIDSTYFTK